MDIHKEQERKGRRLRNGQRRIGVSEQFSMKERERKEGKRNQYKVR
jgi:hypothetical protein